MINYLLRGCAVVDVLGLARILDGGPHFSFFGSGALGDNRAFYTGGVSLKDLLRVILFYSFPFFRRK
jgi:hypothetical protein